MKHKATDVYANFERKPFFRVYYGILINTPLTHELDTCHLQFVIRPTMFAAHGLVGIIT